MFSDPGGEENCGNCCFRVYDSFHDETWCNHEPEPTGLSSRRTILAQNGKCEYWRSTEDYPDDDAEFAVVNKVDPVSKLQPEDYAAAGLEVEFFMDDVDELFNDDTIREGVKRWLKWKALIEEDPLWKDGRHHGDCNKMAQTCMRCYVEDRHSQAQRIVKFLHEELRKEK